MVRYTVADLRERERGEREIEHGIERREREREEREIQYGIERPPCFGTVKVKIKCRFSHRRTIVLLSNRRRSSPVVLLYF